MELVMQAKISRVHGFGLGQSKFFVDFKYSEQAIYFTVSKNGISGRRKCKLYTIHMNSIPFIQGLLEQLFQRSLERTEWLF